jgi:tetratricopeptide (TPR) repeat protein
MLAGLVSLDLAEHHPKDAISRVEDALKRMAPTADLLMLAAQTYGAAGDMDKTESLLKRAIDADPARLQAYTLLGALYTRQRRIDDAKDQFAQIVKRNPQSTSANTMLGMLLEAQGRLPNAEAQYQKVLSIDSRAAVAANNLAWLYVAGNRNLDVALQLAQTAKAQLPNEPHVSDTLGWIYYRKNLAASAIPHLESSVQIDPSDPTTHYHLGMAYKQAGQTEKAKKELQRALGFKTAFEGEAEARKAVAELGG